MEPKRTIKPGDRVIATVEGVVEESCGYLWIRTPERMIKADLSWTRLVVIEEGQVG